MQCMRKAQHAYGVDHGHTVQSSTSHQSLVPAGSLEEKEYDLYAAEKFLISFSCYLK